MSTNSLLTRAMRMQFMQQVNAARKMKPIPFVSTRLEDQSRFDDAPAPTDDDMISKLNGFNYLETHYLKHHPLYEFRDFDDFHVDNYRHWLHGRADYWNTESYPAQISPWEMGSKWNHMFFLIFPFLSFYWLGNQYVIPLTLM